MSKIKATLAVLIAATAFAFTSATPSAATAQGAGASMYEYYVYREALHTGGYSYVQEYGPYFSQAAAEAKCDQLDSQRNFGTWFYGPSWWERQINPNIFIYRNPLLNNLFYRQ